MTGGSGNIHRSSQVRDRESHLTLGEIQGTFDPETELVSHNPGPGLEFLGHTPGLVVDGQQRDRGERATSSVAERAPLTSQAFVRPLPVRGDSVVGNRV